jgi:hypothetical protein
MRWKGNSRLAYASWSAAGHTNIAVTSIYLHVAVDDGQGVADERVAPVVDRKRVQASEAQNLARRQEPPPDRGARERVGAARGLAIDGS